MFGIDAIPREVGGLVFFFLGTGAALRFWRKHRPNLTGGQRIHVALMALVGIYGATELFGGLLFGPW